MTVRTVAAPTAAAPARRPRIAPIARRLVGEFRVVPIRSLLASGRHRRILVGPGFRVVHPERITGRLNAGLMCVGFADRRAGGLIRVLGRLVCTGRVEVSSGNRWYIGPNGVMEVGEGTYFSPNGLVAALNRVSIGAWCAIGWDVQILDDNHHPLTIGDRTSAPEGVVTIGDRVWVGSRVTVLKGTVIGDGCVVASGSVVKGDFAEPGCLIAGVPAKVIRRDVTWEP